MRPYNEWSRLTTKLQYFTKKIFPKFHFGGATPKFPATGGTPKFLVDTPWTPLVREAWGKVPPHPPIRQWVSNMAKTRPLNQEDN
jgi:hypothetical protein